jgi:hypothetical protein
MLPANYAKYRVNGKLKDLHEFAALHACQLKHRRLLYFLGSKYMLNNAFTDSLLFV